MLQTGLCKLEVVLIDSQSEQRNWIGDSIHPTIIVPTVVSKLIGVKSELVTQDILLESGGLAETARNMLLNEPVIVDSDL